MKVIATWHSKTATKICPCVGETLREHSQWGRDLFQRIIIICTFFRKKKLAWGGGRRHNPMSSLRGLAYLSTGVSMAEVSRLCGVHKTIITRLKKKRVEPQYWAGWVASRPGKQTNSPGAGRRRVVFDCCCCLDVEKVRVSLLPRTLKHLTFSSVHFVNLPPCRQSIKTSPYFGIKKLLPRLQSLCLENPWQLTKGDSLAILTGCKTKPSLNIDGQGC